jgi:glycosyltransferase involved in cell wall biosynthesis
MRVHVVDPSAYTPAYDHGLCSALARAGADVSLITSPFAYGEVPPADGYVREEVFYRRTLGPAGSRARFAAKLASHVPNMIRYRKLARAVDVVHFQWLTVQPLDVRLLPRDRPVVLTAHDVLPREPRFGQAFAQRRLYKAVDAVIVHSDYGRRRLVEDIGVPQDKVHVVHHGAFEHLARQRPEHRLLGELAEVRGPVVLFFGLIRPYKGLEVLLEAWRGIEGAELWVVGRPRMPIEELTATAPPGVRFVPRYIPDDELPAFFRRAALVVLPYRRTERFDQSGVLFTALAFSRPVVVSDIGGVSEVARSGAAWPVPPDDPAALHAALERLLADGGARARLELAARAAANGPYSWRHAARRTLAVYRSLLGPDGGGSRRAGPAGSRRVPPATGTRVPRDTIPPR